MRKPLLLADKRIIVMSINVLLLFQAGRVFSQEQKDSGSVDSDSQAIVDTRDTWRLGIAAFTGSGLAPENQYLLTSLPLLIGEKLALFREHHFTDQELAAYRRKIREAWLLEKKRALDQQYQKRDALLFSGDMTTKNYRQLSAAIQSGRESAQTAESLDLNSLEVKRIKPIELVEGESAGKLLDFTLSEKGTAREYDLDFFIWGQVDEVEDYFYLEIYGYNSALGKNLYVYKNAVLKDQLFSELEKSLDQLTEDVYGKPWARIKVAALPEYCEIDLDQAAKGYGTLDLLVDPGEYTLTARSPGFSPQEFALNMKPQTVENLHIALQRVDSRYLFITTFPSNADVYLSSHWLGKSPLFIDYPLLTESVIIQRPGYNPDFLHISAKAPQRIELELMPDLLSRSDYIGRKRDNFYFTFGLFLISVPVTLILNGTYADYRATFEGEKSKGALRNEAEYHRLLDKSLFFWDSYQFSLVATVSLGVISFFELFEYIDANNR